MKEEIWGSRSRYVTDLVYEAFTPPPYSTTNTKMPPNFGAEEESHDPPSEDCLDAPTLAPPLDSMSRPVAEVSNLEDDEQAVFVDSVRPPVTGRLPESGTLIKDYEVLGEIARGAMGIVYRAKQHSLNRLVAIKLMLAGTEDVEEHRKRFEIEAQAAAALDHPGIVPVYEVGSWNNFPFFVMGLVQGRSLADELRDHPLPNRRAAEVSQQVAAAIAHAHDQGIIHRDLKPANILIDETGAARVTDFGVSKFIGASSNLTLCGELIGTPNFMPPEQAGTTNVSIGPASDVYSIGAVLFASLTGRPPFQAASPLEVISQLITKEPVAPSALNATVPVELDVITLKCLRKDPQERYTSATALANDLRRYLRGEPIEAKPISFVQQARLEFRRQLLLTRISGSIAVLLLLLVFIVFIALIHARARESELSTQLELTKKQLTLERSAFERFLGLESEGQRAQPFAEFEMRRLAIAAEGLVETSPDVALQLAVAALELANTNRLSPPAAAIAVLESVLDEPQVDSLGELIQQAKQEIESPLSEELRFLYGVGKTATGEPE